MYFEALKLRKTRSAGLVTVCPVDPDEVLVVSVVASVRIPPEFHIDKFGRPGSGGYIINGKVVV